MITLDIRGMSDVQTALRVLPGKAHKACAIALSMTAKHDIKPVVQAEMSAVFDKPTRYTLNSLKVKYAQANDLSAEVWFKEPARMGEHYLVSQVEGGTRKLKGFEQALKIGKLSPGRGAKINQYGNISAGQIRQILSVLGRAEHVSGYSANITDRSRKTNTKERDYVLITKRHGRLFPGVYKRIQTARGFGAKTKKTFADRSKTYQRGKRKTVIRARGLESILVQEKRKTIKPLLDFYGIATKTFYENFEKRFWEKLNSYL